MAVLRLPCDETTMRSFKVGDFLELEGRIITGRDAAHHWLLEGFQESVAPLLKDSVIYHCGPVVKQHEDAHYSFVAAGPTTSAREEPYQADVIARYGLRGVIGKGGMGAKTLKGCQEVPFVYFHAIGGAASYIAQSVQKVLGVYKMEFGVPEAMWVIEVKDFPVVVTMDSHGGSQHAVIDDSSKTVLDDLLAKPY